MDYLAWLRWPGGFECADCGGAGGWALSDGRVKCRACGRRASPTAGTLFHGSHTPLTVWFELVWRFVSSKQGVSALEVMRDLGLGSYRTAWGLCQRLRSVLVTPGRDRLGGRVEVDEAWIGGLDPGTHGRQSGSKTLVGVAVETGPGSRLGRARLLILPDATEGSLKQMLAACVEPGSVVVTDAWPGYSRVATEGYEHQATSHRQALKDGADPDDLLPGINRVVALVKRWLLATHQGAVSARHLQAYLDEWVFRFNRRSSRSRGLLFHRVLCLALGHTPVEYTTFIASPGANTRPSPATHGQGGTPPSLTHTDSTRPWRTI